MGWRGREDMGSKNFPHTLELNLEFVVLSPNLGEILYHISSATPVLKCV
jgi:hypothetical protein